MRASHAFPESPWPVEVDRLAAGILNSIDRDGWLLANPMNLESPGLMTGIAGIGYQLLRLVEPARVPSGSLSRLHDSICAAMRRKVAMSATFNVGRVGEQSL